MQATTPRPSVAADTPSPEVVRAAFRDLHGRHLHGFALLLTLGDAPTAAQLAVDALDAGASRVDELRHPERAAAWLRARVVRAARALPPTIAPFARRLHAVTDLGVESAVLASLGELTLVERAALIASAVERLDRRDVAVVVGRNGAALERLLTRARRRYAAAHTRAAGVEIPGGPLVDRVRAAAMRAIG